jgi:hypothetical protein
MVDETEACCMMNLIQYIYRLHIDEIQRKKCTLVKKLEKIALFNYQEKSCHCAEINYIS